MAVQLQGRGGGVRRGRRTVMADINVTPMIDVMLVLLIVFMVAAPLITVGVQVDLPKAGAQAVQGTDEPISVSIDKDGNIWLQQTQVGRDDLVPKLAAIAKGANDRRIFVRGDQGIPYGKVMEVMGMINAAGFTRVALITQAPTTARKN